LQNRRGEVSQSFQVAPFNYKYQFNEDSPATTIFDSSNTQVNSYKGGPFQQAVSAVSNIGSQNYNNAAYATYGYEYWSDPSHRSDGYITWFSEGKQTWRITPDSVGADDTARISERIIPEEPMVSLVSHQFVGPALKHLPFSTVHDYELRHGLYVFHVWDMLADH
jgi:beta-glucanase (GH16 family)